MSKNAPERPKFLTAADSDVVREIRSATRSAAATADPSENSDDALSGKASVYIALLVLAAGVCIGLLAPDVSGEGWAGFVTLMVIAVVFERVGITIYGETHISAGVVPLFAIAIIYGAPGAAIAAPIVVLATEVFTISPWYRRLFNMSVYALTNASAALVFHALIDVDGGVVGWWVPAALFAILVNYGVNSVLVGVELSLESGEHWLAVWREKAQWFLPYFIVFGVLGLALATGYLALGVPGILAFVAPPLMMRYALHQYVAKTEQTVLELKGKNAELNEANADIMQMAARVTETYNGTLEALVLALDARDRETKGHSLRVTQYALTMARQMGVDENSKEWVDLQRGALLHDVGKIGVPDYILHKPGPLTPEEWDEMKRHPHIGHGMLKDIAFLSGAASIVEAHHERFDGKGYPNGLAGSETPLGARIFTIADAFDAMTSDRPYRKALSSEEARNEVLTNSGTQFDPKAVQAFLLVFDELIEMAREEHAAEEREHVTPRAA